MGSLFQKLSGFFLCKPQNQAQSTIPTCNPKASALQSEKGCNAMVTKNYNGAIAFFNKAIELDPNDPFPHYSKAMAFEALERYEDALIASDKAIKRDPSCAIAYNAKAMALFALNRYDEALKALEKAIEIDCSHHEPHNLRNAILSKMKRKQQ